MFATTTGAVSHQILIVAVVMAIMTIALGFIVVMRRYTTRTYDKTLGTDVASRQKRVFYRIAHAKGYIYALEGLVILTILLFVASGLAALAGA